MKMYVSFVALMSVLLAISPPIEASGNKEKLELGDNEGGSSAPKSLSKGKKKEKPKGEASDEEGEGEEKSSPRVTLDDELWTEILLQAVSGDIPQGCKDLATFKVTHSPFYHIIKSPYFIQRYKKIVERRFPAAMVDLWEEDERYYRQAGTLFSTLKKGEELEFKRQFSEARNLYALTLQENPLLANSRLLISRLMNLIHYPDFDSFPQGDDQFRDLFLEFVRGKVLGAAKSLFGEKKLQGEKFGADKDEILFKLYFLLKTGFEESPGLKEEMGDDADALEKETEKAKGILEKDLEKGDVKGFDEQDLPLLPIARQLPLWFLDASLTTPLRELYLVRLAHYGLPADKWALGQFYFHRYHTRREVMPASITKAIKWFIQATDDGYVADHPGVIRDLAVLSEKYMGEEQLEEGFKLCRLAAIHGDRDSQFKLGRWFLYRLDVEPDEQKAMEWFELAAGQGGIEAQYELGLIYKRRDAETAAEWFQLAANNDHLKAREELIKLSHTIWWTLLDPKYYSEAVEHCQAEVAKENAEAQYTLGKAYEMGWGVHQDEGKAIQLYTSAAAQHDSQALSELIHRYELGLGVAKDLDKAEELWHAERIGGRKIADIDEIEKKGAYETACLFHGLGHFKFAARYYRLAIKLGYAEKEAQYLLDELKKTKKID